MGSKQQQLRDRVAQYHESRACGNKLLTAKHFMEEGISKSTIYNIIKTFEERQSTVRKVGSGRPAKILTPKVLDNIKKKIDNSDDLSFNQVAKQLNCHRTHVSRTLRTKCGIKHRKKIKCPKYKSDEELNQAKSLCSRLERQFRNKSVIQDDETYFELSNTANDSFKSSNPQEAPREIKYKEKQKFCPKIMVWMAGSERGRSEVFIKPKNNAMDSNMYQKFCLPKLKEFIDRYHSDGNYVFWPDKASSH